VECLDLQCDLLPVYCRDSARKNIMYLKFNFLIQVNSIDCNICNILERKCTNMILSDDGELIVDKNKVSFKMQLRSVVLGNWRSIQSPFHTK